MSWAGGHTHPRSAVPGERDLETWFIPHYQGVFCIDLIHAQHTDWRSQTVEVSTKAVHLDEPLDCGAGNIVLRHGDRQAADAVATSIHLSRRASHGGNIFLLQAPQAEYSHSHSYTNAINAISRRVAC